MSKLLFLAVTIIPLLVLAPSLSSAAALPVVKDQDMKKFSHS
jgi:hypothetical protein